LFTQSSSPVFISQADSGGCYYIESTENTNSYGLASNSVSNVVCIAPEIRVFLPYTLNLSSDNNRFIVKGTGIDHNLSNFQIFTRWGEMLADQPTNEAWYGDYRGEKVPQGLYVYVVNIVSLKGERQVYTGIIRVIESN
jgi:gliding motility-associated-like protein